MPLDTPLNEFQYVCPCHSTVNTQRQGEREKGRQREREARHTQKDKQREKERRRMRQRSRSKQKAKASRTSKQLLKPIPQTSKFLESGVKSLIKVNKLLERDTKSKLWISTPL